MGEVPYQALPRLRFFAYKIRAREKVRKGEGEPGDEASSCLLEKEFDKIEKNSLGCIRRWAEEHFLACIGPFREFIGFPVPPL